MTSTTTMIRTRAHSIYRSRESIIAEILTIIRDTNKEGIQSTKLLYLSRLSSWYLFRYLNVLITNELIIRDVSTGMQFVRNQKLSRRCDRLYITEKGLMYLRMLDDIQQQIGIKI